MTRVVVRRNGTFWGELDGINENFAELYAAMSGAEIRHGEREILATYGDDVSVVSKAKTVTKFGRNDSLGTSQVTVRNQGENEVYVTTNSIDKMSSSDAGDTADIVIEGHTVVGTGTSAVFTFVVQTATLNGQNKVTLATPLARISRAYNNSGTALAGDVYGYTDTTISGGVPTTTAPIHIKIAGASGDNQSFKCATTFSGTDYALVSGATFSVNKFKSAAVDFEIQRRLVGGLFRPVFRVSLDSGAQNTVHVPFNPYLIMPKNSDIRIVATGDSTGISVEASFQAYLAEVV